MSVPGGDTGFPRSALEVTRGERCLLSSGWRIDCEELPFLAPAGHLTFWFMAGPRRPVSSFWPSRAGLFVPNDRIADSHVFTIPTL